MEDSIIAVMKQLIQVQCYSPKKNPASTGIELMTSTLPSIFVQWVLLKSCWPPAVSVAV